MSLTVEQVAKLVMHNGSIYSIIQGEDENSFFSAGGEGIVVKWTISSLERPIAVAKVEGQIFALLFLPAKNHLVIGTMSGGLHVIDLDLKKEIHYITFHEASIFDIKIWNKKIFVCSKDGMLSVWNDETYKLERAISVSDQALRMIAFNPSNNEAAIGSSDNRIYLLDLIHWKINAVLEGPGNSVFSVCYNKGGKELIAGSRDAQLYLYELSALKLTKQVKAHLYTINHIVLFHEGKFFATASRDKTIRLWDIETFDLLKSLDKEKYDGHINSVNKLLWLPSHHFLVSCSDDRSIVIWKISGGASAY